MIKHKSGQHLQAVDPPGVGVQSALGSQVAGWRWHAPWGRQVYPSPSNPLGRTSCQYSGGHGRVQCGVEGEAWHLVVSQMHRNPPASGVNRQLANLEDETVQYRPPIKKVT